MDKEYEEEKKPETGEKGPEKQPEQENKKPQDNDRGQQDRNSRGNDDDNRFWTGRNTHQDNRQNQQKKSPNQAGGPKFDFSRKNRVALGFFVFLIATFTFMLFSEGNTMGTQEVPYSAFINYVESGQVNAVEIQDRDMITFALRNNMMASTRIPYEDDTLMETLKRNNVQITGTVQGISFLQIILQLLPWLIFIGFTVMLWRQTKGANGNVMAFSKSRAKEYMETDVKITFEDVAGQKEAKYELQEVV